MNPYLQTNLDIHWADWYRLAYFFGTPWPESSNTVPDVTDISISIEPLPLVGRRISPFYPEARCFIKILYKNREIPLQYLRLDSPILGIKTLRKDKRGNLEWEAKVLTRSELGGYVRDYLPIQVHLWGHGDLQVYTEKSNDEPIWFMRDTMGSLVGGIGALVNAAYLDWIPEGTLPVNDLIFALRERLSSGLNFSVYVSGREYGVVIYWGVCRGKLIYSVDGIRSTFSDLIEAVKQGLELIPNYYPQQAEIEIRADAIKKAIEKEREKY